MKYIQQLRFPRSWKLNEELLKCYMKRIYSAEISCFISVPEHMGALIPSWQEFENSGIIDWYFMFFELCIVVYLCNKNKKMHNFYITVLI